MVLMSGHHAKVWPTVAAPEQQDRCMKVRRVIFSGIVGAHSGLLQHRMHFTPIAFKLVRHGVSSCR